MAAFDPKKNDNKNFPVREGQGKDSSIRSDKDRASGKDSGTSDEYPQPGTDDNRHKIQDEYDNKAKDKMNK
jgi:hypothetical protein